MLPALPFIMYASQNAAVQQPVPLEQLEPAQVRVGEVRPAVVAVPEEEVAVVEEVTEEAGINFERIGMRLFEA